MDDFFNQQSTGNGVRYDRETMVENNLCFSNGGQGIHCFLSQNIRIRNNTCLNNLDSFDFGGEVTVSESERVYVYNNVLVSSSNRFAAFNFDSSDVFFFFNLIDGPTREIPFNGSNILAEGETQASMRATTSSWTSMASPDSMGASTWARLNPTDL